MGESGGRKPSGLSPGLPSSLFCGLGWGGGVPSGHMAPFYHADAISGPALPTSGVRGQSTAEGQYFQLER